jgi:hypothetical protein
MLFLRLYGPLYLPLPFVNKDVIRHSVPGIVNADEEQKQRGCGHEEKGWLRMGLSPARRRITRTPYTIPQKPINP